MKIVRAKAETRAVISILKGPDQVKLELLSSLATEHFGFRPMHEAFRVIQLMLTQSALDLPSMETFLVHQDLDQESVDLLRAAEMRPIRKLDDAKRLFSTLEHYRVTRRYYEFARDSLTILKQEQKVDLDELMLDMETCLSDMRADAHEEKLYHVGKGADEHEDELMEHVFNNEMPKLLPSTFSNFDIKTGGFGETDLVVPASHKKGGKSIITLNMTVNMYMQNNVDVVYIPLEMSKDEIAERLASQISGVEHTKIRRKTMSSLEHKTLRTAWRRFKRHGKKHGCRFTIWPIANLTIPQMRIRLKPMSYKVIVIDYINLLQFGAQSMPDWQRLNEIARELKLTTKELHALIIAPTQMNDDGSLRYARGIAEHANTVWTWKYGEEEQGTHVITIDQPAVRGWAPFKFQLYEDFARMKVTDHVGGDMDDDFSADNIDSMF